MIKYGDIFADVAELVDALDLGSSKSSCESSSLSVRICKQDRILCYAMFSDLN